MNEEQLLTVQLLTQASMGVGVATVLSWLLDKIPSWNAIDSSKKKIYYFLMCVAVALLSKVALDMVPQAIFVQLDPYVKIVFALIVSWTGGTTFHSATKASSEIRNLKQINVNLQGENARMSIQMRGMREAAEANKTT